MNRTESNLEKALQRERLARKKVEKLLESKSRELYRSNQRLQETLSELEVESNRVQTELASRVAERTEELNQALLAARQYASSLTLSQQKLRAIVQNAAEAILHIDNTWKIDLANPSAEKIFEYEPGEMVGLELWDLLDAQFRLDLDGRILEFAEDGTLKNHGQIGEAQAVKKDGTRFPISISVSVTKSDDDFEIIVLARDETERVLAEQERQQLNDKLVEASRKAGMAEIANGVLHNVGNVLNSLNVSSSMISDKLRKGPFQRVTSVSNLITDREGDLEEFLKSDARGRKVPYYLCKLVPQIESVRKKLCREVSKLMLDVDHIKEIVSAQQSHASRSGVIQGVDVCDLMDECLKSFQHALESNGVHVTRNYDSDIQNALTDRHHVHQILANLLANANQALDDNNIDDRAIELTIRRSQDKKMVQMVVADNGCGISSENLVRIFNYGFTTKTDGHGFGLHSCANLATELGGSLQAFSDGVGKGASFQLEIPFQKTNAKSGPADGHDAQA